MVKFEEPPLPSTLWHKVKRFVVHNCIWISLINFVEILVIAAIITGQGLGTRGGQDFYSILFFFSYQKFNPRAMNLVGLSVSTTVSFLSCKLPCPIPSMEGWLSCAPCMKSKKSQKGYPNLTSTQMGRGMVRSRSRRHLQGGEGGQDISDVGPKVQIFPLPTTKLNMVTPVGLTKKVHVRSL